MEKTSWKVIGAVLLLVLSIIVTGAVGTAVLKRPFLMAPIRSNSMCPLFERGDVVIIKPVDGSRVKAGEIIVFHPREGGLAGQNWVLHRVTGGNPADGFITRGDANEHTDQSTGTLPVQPGDIAAAAVTLGEHQLRIRLLGYPSLWVEQYNDSPYALPLCLGAVGLLLIITELKDGGKRRRKSGTTPAYVVYPAAGMTICILLAATQIAASSFLTFQYEVSPSSRGVLMGSPVGIMQQGDVIERDVATVGGSGFLPMIVSVTTADTQFTFNKSLFLTNPGSKEKVVATVEAKQAGKYKSMVYVGVFLPTLPPALVHNLARVNYWLTLGAVSLVPALPLVLWPVIDRRLRRQMRRAVRRRVLRVTQKVLP
ncbi:Peptidase S24-like [Desulfotomaculum arcticum]|uniref:Signal peptidase I n=1 Tax=Desulfotruncus arcticus DSM 17038 TaxID=1121424 RepID=A0A1I2V5J6_9FIRM|nr:signal peptidase I [Desulfotruncus arcticus]SFG82371.1 Peptidase S24-like [Desulfotomaculum arcticum] [Desulfotruncus arcticus DSM 17038]